MRKLPGLIMSSMALAVLAGVDAGGLSQASATPPTGQFTFTEHGRAQQADSGTVVAPSGYDIVSSGYSVAPGGDTGWRTGPGSTVVAVTKGVLTVQQAEGCSSRDLAAGNALPLPAGKFRLHNAAGEPVELLATFTNLPDGGPAPLVDGPTVPAPACDGFAAAAVPTGLSASNSVRGTIPGYASAPSHGDHGDHGGGEATDPSGATVLSVEAGKDAFMGTYRLEPGFSTGWFVHTAHLVVITKGTWAFYEARDGKCQKVEEYRAGDAWAHGPHPHLGSVEGDEAVELTIFGFNLEHGESAPVFGANTDHLDFSTPPPSECPTTLR